MLEEIENLKSMIDGNFENMDVVSIGIYRDEISVKIKVKSQDSIFSENMLDEILSETEKD